jgi:ferrous iron transport protein A
MMTKANHLISTPVTNSTHTPTKTLLLDELGNAQEATVIAVHACDASVPAELLRRLIEIGFLPDERVRVIARGALGGAPLAVRVGTSTFALRQLEARCVQVALLPLSDRP